MKNNKKIISSIIAAALCAQCIPMMSLTASAAIDIPSTVETIEAGATKDDESNPNKSVIVVSDNSTATVAFAKGYTGTYTIEFDMRLTSPVKTIEAAARAEGDAYFTIKGGSKIGPYIAATGYNAEKDIQTFTWLTQNVGGAFNMKIGDTYHLKIDITKGSSAGGVANLTVTNNDNPDEAAQTLTNQGLRNYGDGNTAEGVTQIFFSNKEYLPKAAMVIDNFKTTQATPNQIKATISTPTFKRDSSKTEDVDESLTAIELTAEENVINIDSYEDVVLPYNAVPMLNGVENPDYTVSYSLNIDSDDAGFVNNKTNKKLSISKDLAPGEYTAVFKAQIEGYDDTKIECPVKFVKTAATDEGTIETFKERIEVIPAEEAAIESFKLTEVYDDLYLADTWGKYDVTWTSDKPDVITADGMVLTPEETTDVTLTASIDVNGTTVSKEFKTKVLSALAEIDVALDRIDMQTDMYELLHPGDEVTTDFNIYTNRYTGKFVKYTFEEKDGLVEVNEKTGRAVIYPQGDGNNAATIVVTATYSKDGVEYKKTKDIPLIIAISPKSVVDEILNGENKLVLSADNNKAVDLDKVQSDLVFVDRIGDVSFSDWKIENAMFDEAKEGNYEFSSDSIGKADGKITAKAEYKKNDRVLYSADIELPFTAVADKDMPAKYVVRCDMLAGENFAGLPSSGDVIEDDKIVLPSEGIFGSKIQWISSVPSVLSNSGKITRQRTAKKVTLTGTVSKGDAPSGEYSISNIIIPSTSGSTSVGSSGGSGGGGGSSSSGSGTNSTVSSTDGRNTNVSYKGTLTPSTSLGKGDITTAQVSSFSDLSAAAWAKDAITALYNKGIINGKSASTFAPNDDITRAEFAKIVVKAFGLEDTSANVSDFSDVKAGDWYYTAVASAYNKGIIKGYEDGRFGVSDKITRQDMAVIIYRAAQVAGKTIAPVKDGVTFDDNAQIASYAAEAVSTLQKGGVINGMTATTFAPSATATRAQAAQMIYGIVK